MCLRTCNHGFAKYLLFSESGFNSGGCQSLLLVWGERISFFGNGNSQRTILFSFYCGFWFEVCAFTTSSSSSNVAGGIQTWQVAPSSSVYFQSVLKFLLYYFSILEQQNDMSHFQWIIVGTRFRRTFSCGKHYNPKYRQFKFMFIQRCMSPACRPQCILAEAGSRYRELACIRVYVY